jgi:hypothetical protein
MLQKLNQSSQEDVDFVNKAFNDAFKLWHSDVIDVAAFKNRILTILDLGSNWTMVIAWMYLYGYSLYKDNHVTQNNYKYVRRGIMRFVYNLGKYLSRSTSVVIVDAKSRLMDLTNVYIEQKTFDGLMSTCKLNQELALFDHLMRKLGKVYGDKGYTAYLSKRPDGDEKITVCPFVDTPLDPTYNEPLDGVMSECTRVGDLAQLDIPIRKLVLHELMFRHGTRKGIADFLGCSDATVSNYMRSCSVTSDSVKEYLDYKAWLYGPTSKEAKE